MPLVQILLGQRRNKFADSYLFLLLAKSKNGIAGSLLRGFAVAKTAHAPDVWIEPVAFKREPRGNIHIAN